MWWRNIEPLVAAGYEVIVPDLRGHGDSDLSADDTYDLVTYEGAGHGFNNESPERYNEEAADLSRKRTRDKPKEDPGNDAHDAPSAPHARRPSARPRR